MTSAGIRAMMRNVSISRDKGEDARTREPTYDIRHHKTGIMADELNDLATKGAC